MLHLTENKWREQINPSTLKTHLSFIEKNNELKNRENIPAKLSPIELYFIQIYELDTKLGIKPNINPLTLNNLAIGTINTEFPSKN